MKIHSNDWEMILNNAHDLSAEYILILIIHYEIALLFFSIIRLSLFGRAKKKIKRAKLMA